MNLADLAFACYIYAHITDFDSAYFRFVDKTRPVLDLRLEAHRLALLQWLNDWGCRQFAKNYHRQAAQEIAKWYEITSWQLFPPERTLLALSRDELAGVETAYDGLVHSTACIRTLAHGQKAQVDFGPTGTAKILFALRPGALLPWDQPIRAKFNLDDTAHSYGVYLGIVRDQLDELKCDCEKRGHSLDDVPRLIDRPTSSIVKLVDEYFWVTETRGCPAPSQGALGRWADWLKQ